MTDTKQQSRQQHWYQIDPNVFLYKLYKKFGKVFRFLRPMKMLCRDNTFVISASTLHGRGRVNKNVVVILLWKVYCNCYTNWYSVLFFFKLEKVFKKHVLNIPPEAIQIPSQVANFVLVLFYCAFNSMRK